MENVFVNVIPATYLKRDAAGRFTYRLPANILRPLVGSLVLVPFGKKEIPAIVTSIEPGKPARDVKDIVKVLEPRPIFTPQLFQLAQNLKQSLLVAESLMIKAMLPKVAPKARFKPAPAVELAEAPKKLVLNAEQSQAVAAILDGSRKTGVYLLHGVTGSGKTEVYLRVLERLLETGKQALVLVPEISLTPQTLQRFTERFPELKVAVVHSKISYGQKYAIWKNVFSKDIRILIGPRSAVFAPFTDLGLIVIDEEHDPSYKQSEQSPKFDARRACEELAKIWSCPLIYGDATPALETYHRAVSGEIGLLSLPRRIGQELPQTRLIDMQAEARAGNFDILSETLVSALTSTLKRGRQSILFLNRRGAATSLVCRDCGKPELCLRCETPLVYHAFRKQLVCHHCGRIYPQPRICSACGSERLKFFGTGTEKVEAKLTALFPNARILRFDSDTVKKKKELKELYERFAQRDFDILVGTQLLAKGWDFESVALIGVVNADTALSLPDFRANERTFQLITQVAGRAGRRQELGSVYLQTYLPENFALKAALKHDYEEFYQKEIEDRKIYLYPPFSKLIKCTVKHANLERAMELAEALVLKLKNAAPDMETPVAALPFTPKLRGIYRVYVIIKQARTVSQPALGPELAAVLNALPSGWDIDVDPDSLL